MHPLVSASSGGLLHPHSRFVVLDPKSAHLLPFADHSNYHHVTSDLKDDSGDYNPPSDEDDGSYKPKPGLEGEYLEETPADVKIDSYSGKRKVF